MDNLLLNPKTESELSAAAEAKAHAYLIHGGLGSGKYTLAVWLAENLLEISEGKLAEFPNYLHIQPVKDSIGIEEIRLLQSFLRLKTTGKNQVLRRAIIIENAHDMTVEAQNSLLKSLEEPPVDTVIILTAIKSKSILPTVYSRVQQIEARAPLLDQVKLHYSEYDQSKLQKMYSISGGAASLLNALMSDKNDHPLVIQLEKAKIILGQSRYERLIQIDELAKDKNELRGVIYALKQIASAGLKQAANTGNNNNLKRWHDVLSKTVHSEENLDFSPNLKLLLTDLMLSL